MALYKCLITITDVAPCVSNFHSVLKLLNDAYATTLIMYYSFIFIGVLVVLKGVAKRVSHLYCMLSFGCEVGDGVLGMLFV